MAAFHEGLSGLQFCGRKVGLLTGSAMKKQFGILAIVMLAVAGIAATSAYAFDITKLRDSPADNGRRDLQSNGFHYVGTYNDLSNEWDMWFNRGTGECVGFTQKGRKISRAKTFKTERCREADRGGFGGRHDDHYGGYSDHHGDRDRYGDHGRYGDRDVPSWMVGHFSGHSRILDAEMFLDIAPDGTVVATLNGRRGNGEFRPGQLRIGVAWYDVDRDPDGFTLRERGNKRNVVHYHRR